MIPFKIEKNKREFYKLIILSFLLLLFLSIITSNISAKEEFILLDEIHSGMEGIGKTVFSGTKVEEFNVQVIDVIAGTGIDDDYILVKLSGEKIDNNGGISAGMSGTPVYLKERLAGAISHAWEMSEHNLCLVTPIERMLKLFNYINSDGKVEIINDTDIGVVSIPLNNSLKNNISEKIPECEAEFLAKSNDDEIYSLSFRQIKSPLLINGFNERALRNIESSINRQYKQEIVKISDFQKYNSIPDINSETSTIVPGSSVGVQLSAGDANVLTIGTATYCKGEYLLAFGHPFLHSGDVSYLLSAVYIYHSFPSIVMPFKLGFPYKLAGMVIQDRDAGILAFLNNFPKVVSCKVSVGDIDKNINIQRGTKIVTQNDLIESITSALIIEAIDKTINRIGQGTATVHLELLAEEPDGEMIYENMFFSKDDIAIQCSSDFEEIMDLVTNNYGETITLSEIKVDIKISEDNKSAMITDVKLNKEEYLPGDIIEADIIIKPFRKPEESKSIKLELPDNMESEEVILIIRGGTSRDSLNDKSAISQEKEKYLLSGWEDIKKQFQEKVKNNQVVAELIPINQQEQISLTNEDKLVESTNNEIKRIVDTNFIIEGYHETYLSIKNGKNKNKDRDL
jgi:hypothetical protein